MILLSVGEALAWFSLLLALLTLDWWVSTPPATSLKNGPPPDHSSFGYPDQVEEYLLLTGNGLQAVWHGDDQNASEESQETEIEEGFVDSTW